MNADISLIDALHARRGIVCAVGAGGKKSALYRLLALHPGRAAFSSSVFTYDFPTDLPAHTLIAPPEAIIDAVTEAATTHDKLAFACPSEKAGRLVGLEPADILACHAQGQFDVSLIKADGARMRLMKAPAAHEPNIVLHADTVLALVSARIVGKALSERYTHRPQQIAAVTEARMDEPITTEHVAQLIASPQGLLKGVASATVVPIINMADNAQRLQDARAIAHMALRLSDRYDHVAITDLRAAKPLLAVVTRD